MKMFNSTRLKLLAAGVLSASVIVGCGSDKKADGPLSGSLTAAQGALSGASCVVTNNAGTALGVVTTSATGTVDLVLQTVGSDFPLIVSCTGGNYFDEANPTAPLTPNTETVRSIMPDLATYDAVGRNLAVTPFTELAVALYKSITPVSDQVLETAIKSLTEIAALLAPGLIENGSSLDLLAGPTPVTDANTDLSGGSQADIYAVYLAGLAQVAKERGTVPATTPADLMRELSNAITNGTPMPADVVNNLFPRAQAYASGKGASGFTLTVQAANQKGKGGVAVKPKVGSTTGGTGGTGGTGATGAGATGG